MSARGQIPETFIQEVLARADIVEIVGRHVALRKGGANLLGLCPFHGEKSPSFTVSPSKQFYHCFGCGAHGDAIRFLMEHGGLGFVDAVTELAQQVGLQVPQQAPDPEEQARASQARARQASLSGALKRAADHYQDRLRSDARAIDYLKGRGLSGAVAKAFGLGYAPAGWHALSSAFADYDDPLLVESGLLIQSEEPDGARSRRYDRFRDRIMFPIRSTKGEVIGFGGRVLDGGEPKYLNSPETPVFVKGRELYGLFEGRSGIRERGFALVVEGYMDVVALAQSGFGNAVATLGTACTTEHIQKLLRFTDHVVFSFDGDAAGRRAAGRALEAALPQASDLRSFKFLFLPAEHDPDSFVREHGTVAFEQQIAQALPLSRMLLERAGQEADTATAEGRARLLAQARPLWSLMPECALRQQILSEIAQAARMEPQELALQWGLRRPQGRSAAASSFSSGAGAGSRMAGFAQGAGSRPGARVSRRPAVQVRQPADQAARMLLLNSALWFGLDGQDQELLSGLSSWHGELFRWLERDLNEQGSREWPALREEIGGLPFGTAAVSLVDDAEVPLLPSAEDLRQAIAQAQRSLAMQDNLRVLGRIT